MRLPVVKNPPVAITFVPCHIRASITNDTRLGGRDESLLVTRIDSFSDRRGVRIRQRAGEFAERWLIEQPFYPSRPGFYHLRLKSLYLLHLVT